MDNGSSTEYVMRCTLLNIAKCRLFKPCDPVAESFETLEEGHRTFSLPDATWFLLVTSGVSHVSRPVAPVPYGELNEVSDAAIC